ncbi:MAG: ribonuclease H-like domain-containing protein [Methanobacteriota archaeon]
MLRETFLHVDGVGYRTEERLWRAGVLSWDEFPRRAGRAGIKGTRARRIEEELGRSEDALRRGRYRYFASCLPPREHWRAWPDFRGDVAYLDIETTGLSIGRDAVTVVGVYDGRRERSFVKGVNLSMLPDALARARLLVTYNGVQFDVPFLRRAFPRMRLDQIHVDLRYPLRRIGLTGGLKSIEAQVGIERSDEAAGLSGADAVRLWHAHEAGDHDALDRLLDYNMADVVNLEPLAELAYKGLRSMYLEGDFVTADAFSARAGAP